MMNTDSDTFIIKDVSVFTGQDIIEDGYVFVKSGMIEQVGPGNPTDVSPTVPVISSPGNTLTPGLIDAHIHALGGNVQSIEQSLRFGVTTVCDMHNSPADNAKLKELADNPANKSKYADFKCAGLGAVVDGGWPIPVMKKEFAAMPHVCDKIVSSWPMLEREADAEPFVKQQVEENGASYIKLFHEVGDTFAMNLPEPPMEVQKAVVQAAHKHGKIAVGHAFSYKGAMTLLRAGVDGLAHVFLDPSPGDEFVQAMLENGAHCCPTFSCCASHTDEGQDTLKRFFNDPFAQRMLLNKTPGESLGFAVSSRPKASVQHAFETTRTLYKAGVPLIVGSDAAGKHVGTPYGLGVHMEMRYLANEVGMSPVDILRAATATPADRFGFADRGKIEVGRKADLVLIEGDVQTVFADDQGLCLPIKMVWRDGIAASVFD